MKKSLFILPALLLSSTVQIEAMQDDNNQLHLQNNNKRSQILDKISSKLDEFKLDNTEKEKILLNIIISKLWLGESLYSIFDLLSELPKEGNTIKILTNISKMRNYEELDNLYKILIIFPEVKKAEDILLSISIMNECQLWWLCKILEAIQKEVRKKLITEDILLFKDIIEDISKKKDISKLLVSLFNNLPEKGEQGDLFFKISKNISKMNNDKYKLYALSNVLDILPESVITEDILFNLSKILYRHELFAMYLVFCDLPEEVKTTEILTNIIKINNENKLNDLRDVLSNLPEEGKTTKILFNITNDINKNKLFILNFVLRKLPEKLKTTEILFNISKMNRDTLDNFNRVLLIKLPKVNLPKAGQIKEILFNISKMNKDTLDNLYDVLIKLPKAWKITDILFIFSKIKNKDILYNLEDIIRYLPESGKMKNILLNIGEINDKDILSILISVIRKLPEEGKTEDILKNIIKLNYKKMLKLSMALFYARSDEQKMQVLRDSRVIPEEQNIYNK